MRFAQYPSRRDEAWRYSDLRAALNRIEGPEIELRGEGHVIERMMAGFDQEMPNTIVSAGSAKSVIERFDAEEGVEFRAETVAVAQGATFSRVVLQAGLGAALNLITVELLEGAAFRQFTLAEGADLARLETQVVIAEPGAHVELFGVYLADKGRHADLTSHVLLKAEGAIVRQLTRGVARKGGRGVFQGKFKVERKAQKTDAEMRHNALLLEQGAEVFAKPELEIYADDVACGHGNTVGQLDENALFYLRQRGIPQAEARAMITRAFLMEAIPGWLEDEVRAEVEGRIDAWLRAAP